MNLQYVIYCLRFPPGMRTIYRWWPTTSTDPGVEWPVSPHPSSPGALTSGLINNSAKYVT